MLIRGIMSLLLAGLGGGLLNYSLSAPAEPEAQDAPEVIEEPSEAVITDDVMGDYDGAEAEGESEAVGEAEAEGEAETETETETEAEGEAETEAEAEGEAEAEAEGASES